METYLFETMEYYSALKKEEIYSIQQCEYFVTEGQTLHHSNYVRALK